MRTVHRSTLQFLGAAGTVTGSKHLVRHRGRQWLLDCGLFQGLKQLRLRNWSEPPFRPSDIDAVVLSHAHIDHCGYLPLLARRGFRGPIFCTAATAALVRLVLLDAASLQEEEAEFANRTGYSRHKPARPLYTEKDVRDVFKLLETRRYAEPFSVDRHATALFRHAGHILGAASIELTLDAEPPIKVVFSGDIGRWHQPIIHDPEPPTEADILLVEATYAGRSHPPEQVEQELTQVVRQTIDRGGVLLIPAFAVGRTQEVMWHLRNLEDRQLIPKLPVYIDSPMATDVSLIYCQHPEEHDLDVQRLMATEGCPLTSHHFKFTRTPGQSKELNAVREPCIIISASGMATGGRIVHHLRQRLPDEKNTVLLVGFQAAGTRGRLLQDGAESVRIHGQDVPVNAQIVRMDGLSAHGDHDDLMRWMSGLKQPPRMTYTVHGEPDACEYLANTLRQRGWHAEAAHDGAIVPLSIRSGAENV